ncbi:MNIO family bufferin maturase [Pararhodobacter marinus]|uniref:MNIO family bufferin maturase n=1 Tax=Pararhodobacter marinus TaxID=2184063 RepID=UPI003511B204
MHPDFCRPDTRLPATSLPRRAGLGFKAEHFEAALQAPVAFYEIHAENYLGAGGAPHAMLTRLRADHALSVHGVGLSIGGAGPLDRAHLARVKALVDRYQPETFSEHLAWSSHGAAWLNDLLPLPYTDETLARICAHVDAVQSALGRPMLLENPATYVTFAASTWSEPDFLSEVARRTGCGLLLDINNVFVSAINHRSDPRAYLADFPLAAVGEIHLAGHEAEDLPGGPLLIDSHSRPVADPVWTLYAEVIARTGPLPTLIEWDNDVPAFDVLTDEARRADRIMEGARHAVLA